MTSTQILERLNLLNEFLLSKETYVTLDVYGGAAIALCYSSRRCTEDIDCIVKSSNEKIKALLAEFNHTNGFEYGWINQAVAVFVPKTEKEINNFLQLSNLRVDVCSPNLLLAMKCRAFRDTDVEDIKLLMEIANIKGLCQLIENNDRFFPNRPLSLESLSSLMTIMKRG